MVEGQAQGEQGKGYSQWVWDIAWNTFKRNLRRRNIFRYTTPEGEAVPIIEYLPLSLNESLLGILSTIEGAWKIMDGYLWKDDRGGGEVLLKAYHELGHYTDRRIVELEAAAYRTGSGLEVDPDTRTYRATPIIVQWDADNAEELYAFGTAKIESVLNNWSRLERPMDGNAVSLGMDADNRRFATALRQDMADYLTKIRDIESEMAGMLDSLIGKHNKLNDIRKVFFQEYDKYNKFIRFKHTYKVIKLFYWDKEHERPVYFDPMKNRILRKDLIVSHNPTSNTMTVDEFTYKIKKFEPWPWEEHTGRKQEVITPGGTPMWFMTGLDENGYPLEIDDNGIVLLDKWWYEIGENLWQRYVIAKKPGGREILNRIARIRSEGVRVVDKRFATEQAYIDLLEMAVYMYNEVDSVRDDLRDGRYHKHSKSTTDYIIHAERRFRTDPDKAFINVNKFTIPWEILKEPITLEFNPFNRSDSLGYIKARPHYFNSRSRIPAEELEVTRKYQIREYNPATNSLELGPERERPPSSLNPAFDRRALNSTNIYINWGKMYYYEDWEGINRWSENPYPHITTRGIAKYMMYWIAVRTQNLNEAIEAADKIGAWDIGVRRPLVGGPYVTNPFRDTFSQG